MGRFGAFMGSTVAFCGSVAFMPLLAVPTLGLSLYTAQKLLNETMYKSYKDLAFIVRKKGPNMKIYQDAVRPDLFREIQKLDSREKLGFLQLQALVGLTKFDGLDKNGNPITLETDSHGPIRKAFQTLAELGYLQNYEESYLKQSRLIAPKLAFANTDIRKKVDIYNMKFQKADREIDFEDEKLRRMFPMVFAKRGLIAKRGYNITKDENGAYTIEYPKKKDSVKDKEPELPKEETIRDRVKSGISEKAQSEFVKEFLERQENEPKKPIDNDLSK